MGSYSEKAYFSGNMALFDIATFSSNHGNMIFNYLYFSDKGIQSEILRSKIAMLA